MTSIEMKAQAWPFLLVSARVHDVIPILDKSPDNVPWLRRIPGNACNNWRYVMTRENELLGPMGPEVRRAWWL